MCATIILFPADRCRQPASVVELAEREAYARAANDHGAFGWHAPSVETMIRLSCEGACAVTAAKAAAWLHEQCNVMVVQA